MARLPNELNILQESFKPNMVFVSKAGAYTSGAKLALATKIKPG